VEQSYDVTVVGAGAAGLATALASARLGAHVALVEQRSTLGGTVTHGLIHTIAGLYDGNADYINPGLPVELAERLLKADATTRKRKMGRLWVLNAAPSLYSETVETWLRGEPNIDVHMNTAQVGAVSDGERVSHVVFRGPGGEMTIRPQVLVDCTGDATVVGSVDPALQDRDGETALAGLIVRIRNVNPEEFAFPRNVSIQRRIQGAIEDGLLPPECTGAWLDAGVFDDEIYVKFSLNVLQRPEGDPIPSKRTDLPAQLMAFLSGFEPFAGATVAEVGQLSYRDGARARGEYQLTASDVRGLSHFPDAACRCGWPIEHWDAKRNLMLEYLQGGGTYDIPVRSLKVKGIENLWAAGKCLSSDYLAQASARVSGCCWAMGEAVADAALR
jgi:hypothetical protein